MIVFVIRVGLVGLGHDCPCYICMYKHRLNHGCYNNVFEFVGRSPHLPFSSRDFGRKIARNFEGEDLFIIPPKKPYYYKFCGLLLRISVSKVSIELLQPLHVQCTSFEPVNKGRKDNSILTSKGRGGVVSQSGMLSGSN